MRFKNDTERQHETIDAVLTGVGFGASGLSIESQAELLESVTLKSIAPQAAKQNFTWIIACDYHAPEECCNIADRVSGNGGAALVWVMDVEQSWGEMLAGMYAWDGWDSAGVTTVGCPAGGAMNTKYLETVRREMGDAKNACLTFNGGVLRGDGGQAGLTKIKHNEFVARREYVEAGWMWRTCYSHGQRDDVESEIVLQREKNSKTAWAMPATGRVSSRSKIDLGQFGL